MKTDFIPKVITLLAGAVISIVCVITDIEVTRALEILLATLLVFYIIGCLVRRLIEKVIISNSVLRNEIDKETEEDIDAGQKQQTDSEKEQFDSEKEQSDFESQNSL